MTLSVLFRKFKTLCRLIAEAYVATRGWIEPYTLHGLIKRYTVAHYPKDRPSIVATYITFHGDEFIEASIASIYPFVNKIVFFHSNISWDGKTGNTVKAPVHAWRLVHDREGKIVEVDFDCIDQQVQRESAWNYIKEHWNYDFLMVIDTDEVWSPEAFERAIYHLKGEPKANAFFPRMNFYIKSPYYRVSNTTANLSTFLRKGYSPSLGIRGTEVKPRYNMQDVRVDHFHLVHYSEETSFAKQRRSHGEERKSLGLSVDTYIVDFDTWEREVWTAIPDTKDLFIRTGYENTFKGIHQISYDELPEAVRLYSRKILDLFDPKTGMRKETL